MKDYIFVGAGLFNCVLARLLADNGNKCIIYEKRDHIGGNCYDYIDEDTNIIIHKYGPHILHFDNLKIYDFLSKYTKLEPFFHSVKIKYKNIDYSWPINLDTINKFFCKNLSVIDVEQFINKQKLKIDAPKNLEEKIQSLIGNDLYEAFFKEYTYKQWGLYPKQLNEAIISRIPIRTNYNSSYYKKRYSYLPKESYSSMFLNMLDSNNIQYETNVEIKLDEIKNFIKNRAIVFYSGCIDELFDYEYGELPYRSLNFKLEKLPIDDYQGISVVNYPESKYAWTRICEPKHFYSYRNYKDKTTIIMKEIPIEYKINKGMIPYYPIVTDANSHIFNKYVLKIKEIDNLYNVGRLGCYCYTDMENTINNAFDLFNQINNGVA